MGKIQEVKINRFDGGISDDLRQNSATQFGITQHFDTWSSPYKLIPFRDSEADNTTQVGVMSFSVTGDTIYGLGVETASGPKIQIYQKTSHTGSWSKPSTSTSGTMTHVRPNLFIRYKGLLYHLDDTGIAYWTIGGTYTASTGTYDISFTKADASDGSASVTQGFIHPKSDILFIGYNVSGTSAKIFKIDGTTPTASALSLPTNMEVTALAEYGSYLAIACRPAFSGGLPVAGASKVFLWDMVSSTPQEVIDFGIGDLWILANVEGRLVGVMNEASSGADITFSPTKVYIKTWAGGTPSLFKTLSDTGLVIAGLVFHKPFISTVNGLSFGLYSTGSLVPTGIYTFSRAGENSPFAVTMERLIHNSTAITTFLGFARAGNIMYTSYNFVVDTSSNVGRTNDSSTAYTATSAIETQKFYGESQRTRKKLVGVTVNTEPLPAAGQVVLKYKKDAETSYTTLYTNTTDDSISHSTVNVESTGATLPEFREIQFRVESTGAAVITGLSFQYEDKGDDLY